MLEQCNQSYGSVGRVIWLPPAVVAVALLALGGATEVDAETIAYEVEFRGIPDNTLRRMLEEASDTLGLRDRPPATLALLRRRAQGDLSAMENALHSQGFYAGAVEVTIQEEETPVRVVFDIERGPRYRFGEITLKLAPDAEPPPFPLPSPAEFEIRQGDRALSRTILNAERAILRYLTLKGYPFPLMETRRVVVDHAEESVNVTYVLRPGPYAEFGPVTFEGAESVKEDFLAVKLPWEEGDPYDNRLLRRAQENLGDTGLFALTRVTAASEVDEAGRLPIHVELSERRPRTIRAGVSYKTDERFGARLAWEHRNLFQRAERLTLGAGVSGISTYGEASFEKPVFSHPDQTLRLQFRAAEDRPDAYDSLSLMTSAMLERRLSPRLVVGGGIRLRAAEVEQFEQIQRAGLIALPLFLDWDGRDDPLNPTEGAHLNVRIAPYHDVGGHDLGYLRAFVSGAGYFEAIEDPSLVLAARGGLGLMYGTEREDIPADERFYAGGGGSIRGYPYQTVGPLVDDIPTGGLSLVELSLEARYRFTDTMGVVAFLDGGNVYETEYPEVWDDLRWGAGLGFRYYTPIGPLRVDIAAPLDRRRDVDDAFQLYVSVGHAF